MMARSTNLSVAGAVKPAGATTEGGLLAALGLLFNRFGDRSNAATQGARQAHHSNLTELRAPETPPEREFHCPLWPGCNCPGDTMRPECPGLKDWQGQP